MRPLTAPATRNRDEPEPSGTSHDLSSASSHGEPTGRPARLDDPARLHLLAESGLIEASAAARLPTLDRVARLAARAVRAPVAQVNLVTADAQIPAAAFVDPQQAGADGAPLDAADAEPGGAWRRPVGLASSYCQHVVRAGAPVVVGDAATDPLVSASPATREAGIGAYAAVPVFTPTGEVLGTVCVVDFRSRTWLPGELDALGECAALAGEEVAARLGAAHALRENGERLRLALQAARLGSWSLDLRTDALAASGRCKAHFGRGAEAPFTYAELCAAIHPDDRGRVREAMRRAVETSSDYVAEYRAVLPDGAERWIAATGHPIYDGAGVPLRMVGLSQDVTERRTAHDDRERLLAAEHAARLRTERLQALTAALAAAATEAEVCAAILREGRDALGATAAAVALPAPPGGADDRTLYLELAAAAGWPAEAAAAWERFPASRPDGGQLPHDVNSPVADAIRRGAPVWLEGREDVVARYPVLAPLVEAMGLRAWLAVPFTLGDDGDRPVLGGLIAVLRDRPALVAEDKALLLAMGRQCAQALERARLVDAERAAAAEREGLYAMERQARAAAEEAYEEAAAANRAKAEFLAVMSHELRTPLNAIGGYAELIDLGVRGPVTDAQRADLARIQAAQRHLIGLVTDVLNFARVEGGHVQYALADVAVAEAVGALEAMIAPQFRAKGVAYAVAACAPEVRVRADPDRLQQVLLNLATNALKFTEAGGRVEVACDAAAGDAAGAVVIRVRDTGIGIPPEKLDHIFEPFVQVNQRLTRQHDGVGLGLAISRDLARRMGGDLTVESEPGVGSTFALTLPGAAAPGAAAASDQRLGA